MKNTPAGKGIRTAIQTVAGLVIGLVSVIWAVPGVPEAVIEYIRENALLIVASVSIPSGLVSYIQNKLGK
jgi:hypothetical protein